MNMIKFFTILLMIFLTTASYGETPSMSQTFIGENINYSIKNMGVKVGKATLTFNGPTSIDGQNVELITFTAKGLNFYDQEKIYVDPTTFKPLRVDRDVDFLGKKEKIQEFYDQKNGQIKIVKTANNETTEQIIEKEGSLDNIYCFIYRYRIRGNFKVGDEIEIRLPTQDVKISLVKKMKIKAAREVHDAYFMQSQPNKYRVWFDQQNKIPLRIDGAVGFGSTSMILTDYKPGSQGSGQSMDQSAL